jgi:hypothetical protein
MTNLLLDRRRQFDGPAGILANFAGSGGNGLAALPMTSPTNLLWMHRMTRRTLRMTFLFLAALLFVPAAEAVAACSGSGLKWSCTAGSTLAEVQNAYNSAADGATITFAGGSYNWTTGTLTLSNTKGVTLACANERACVVTKGTATTIYMDMLSGENTRLYRLTGFVFRGGSGSVIWWSSGNGTTSSTMSNCRIDHNTIDRLATSSIAILLGGGSVASKFRCVIDNNVFSGLDNFMSLKYLGPGNPDLYPASVRGTRDNVFVEDNVYDFEKASDLGSGCIDVWYAGSVVVRNNESKNCLWTAHGTPHKTVVNFEFYKNTVRRTAGSGFWTNGQRLFHHQGSGEILAWGNAFGAEEELSGIPLDVTHYRSASPADAGYPSEMGRCNGTSARDGNANSTGYPCWMQPGRAPAGGSPRWGTLAPMYFWMNANAANGNRVNVYIENLWPGPPLVSDHIKENRDYYSAVSNSAQTSRTTPFNGTVGVGFGTIANRPATCTTNPFEAGGGVGYWATDQGEWDSSHDGPDGMLYRCSASNTWTPHYQPYQYPHPLRGSETTAPVAAKPRAPIGLTVKPQ